MNTSSPQHIERHTTRAFYLDLLHLSPPTLPALQQWSTSLLPQPVFNAAFWKNIYTPLSANKHCDITWKIAHRNLPTALSLYRMAVYPTTQAHTAILWKQSSTFCYTALTSSPSGQPFATISTKLPKNNSRLLPLYNSLAVHLLNWALTLARYAIHKSATEYRLRSTLTDPIIIFRSAVQAHISPSNTA